jgi:tetratricopeptide (TPR) repeat protein
MYSLAMNKEILAGTVYSSWKDASKVTLRKLTTAQAIDAIESNSRKIKRLTGQLEKSQANAENEKKQREQLHERLKELEAASAKVMRQNRELQRSYQVLKKKQAVLEQKYKTESEKMRKELEGSKKENKKLSDQLTKTKKENTALEEKLKKSYEKIKELDEEKKSHAKQIEKLEITEELFYLATRHYSDHAKLTESLFYFARKYWRSQEYDKAGDLYRYVSNNYPDRDLAIKAQAWYVRCKIKMDNETAAKKAINTLKNDYSQHKDLYAELFSLSDEYRDKKDYVRAKALCRYVSDNSTNTKLTSRATGWVSIYEIKLDNETAARQTTDAFWEKYSSTEDFAEKVNIIAGTLRKQGFYKRGIELCQRLLDSGSNKKVQLIANTGIVKSYLQSGDHIKAEELLDRICADFAGHEELGEALFGIYKNYFYSAFSHISKKPDEKGREVLQKCLTILQRIIINCPGDKYVGKAFAKRAICYSKLDDEANAKAAIERLIEEAKDIPDLTRTFYFASEDYYYLKNYEYTKKFALKSIEYSKNSKDPKASHFAGLSAYMIVLCADKSKDKATQKEYLHLIMEKYPKSHFASRVPNELGRLYRKQKDYEQAIYWFTQQRELYDDRDSGRSATFHLGVTYAKMLDDHAKAAEVFENHMKWYPSSSKEFIYILLATSYDKLGRKADAIAVLNDALERCRYKSYAKRYKELINKIQEGAKQ